MPYDPIKEYADAIACQAEAIANGTVIGPRYSAVLRLRDNVNALLSMIPDDRDHTKQQNEPCKFDIGDRIRTTQEWADFSGHKRLTGTVTEITGFGGVHHIHVTFDGHSFPRVIRDYSMEKVS